MTNNHIFLLPVVHSAEGHFAQKLLNDLMENYSSALRPVDDTDRALNVTLQITLSQIKDMVGMNSLCLCDINNSKLLICDNNYSNCSTGQIVKISWMTDFTLSFYCNCVAITP